MEEFDKYLYTEWLPSFCNARAEDFQPEGFVAKSLDRISDYDALWFVRAIETGLVAENGGFFQASKSKTREQIFWSGRKGQNIRKLFLWAEPIITVGAFARLVEQYCWPKELIETQTKFPWPFDLMCFEKASRTELVACEIKKSDKEVELLISQMLAFSVELPLESEPEKSSIKNAYRKVVGIRESWPKWFWALGPNGKGRLFEIRKKRDSVHFEMLPVGEGALNYLEAG